MSFDKDLDKFDKTLFIPSLMGQIGVWREDVLPQIKVSEKAYQLGNAIGLGKEARDSVGSGRNMSILASLYLSPVVEGKITRIVGANEMYALNDPEAFTNAKSRRMLRNAWFGDVDFKLVVAAVDKNRLITHGGMTYGQWLAIGKPETAHEAANRLNEIYADTLSQPKGIKFGGPPNFAVSPIWAESFMELYPSWITAPEACPFDQIHGTTSLALDRRRSQLGDSWSMIFHADWTNFSSSCSVVMVKGSSITTVDLGLEDPYLKRLPENRRLHMEMVPKEELKKDN